MRDNPKRYSLDEKKLVGDRLVALWEDMQKQASKPRRRPLSLSDPRMWWFGLPPRGEPYPVLTKDRMRWRLVCVLHDEFELAWDKTFEHASKIFADTSYRGGVETMQRAYKKIERSLPEADRRKAERRGKHRLPLG
jgi:hypothetical protein